MQRAFGFLALMFFSGPVLAQEMTPAERQAGVEASTRYSACINQWMQKLAPSKDPIANVADAVMAECRDELNKFIVSLQPMFRALSLGEIRESMLKGQKQFITTELVKKRVEPVTTGSIDEPKTREGKIAQCDARAAEWRQWAAEREGGVRVAMMMEQADNDEACRKAAENLPLASSRAD